MEKVFIEQKPIFDWVQNEFELAKQRGDLLGMHWCNNFLQQLVLADTYKLEVKQWEFFGNDDDLGCSYCCPECRHQVPEEDFWSSDMQEFKPYKECPKCGIRLEA